MQPAYMPQQNNLPPQQHQNNWQGYENQVTTNGNCETNGIYFNGGDSEEHILQEVKVEELPPAVKNEVTCDSNKAQEISVTVLTEKIEELTVSKFEPEAKIETAPKVETVHKVETMQKVETVHKVESAPKPVGKSWASLFNKNAAQNVETGVTNLQVSNDVATLKETENGEVLEEEKRDPSPLDEPAYHRMGG